MNLLWDESKACYTGLSLQYICDRIIVDAAFLKPSLDKKGAGTAELSHQKAFTSFMQNHGHAVSSSPVNNCSGGDDCRSVGSDHFCWSFLCQGRGWLHFYRSPPSGLEDILAARPESPTASLRVRHVLCLSKMAFWFGQRPHNHFTSSDPECNIYCSVIFVPKILTFFVINSGEDEEERNSDEIKSPSVSRFHQSYPLLLVPCLGLRSSGDHCVLSDIDSKLSCDILSDISSDILSGISSDIFSDISSDILSDIFSDISSDILSATSSDILF